MKNRFCLTIFTLLFFTITHAQEEDKPLYLYHTHLQFQQLDFTEFNQQLTDLNLLTLSNNTASVGAGVTRIYRRFVSDLSVVFGIEESSLRDDITGPRSQFRHVGFQTTLGINILNPESDWFFGPEVAWNGSFQQILVTGRNNGGNFQQAALNMVYNFERVSTTTDIGLSLYKLIRYNDIFKKDRIISIRVRGGYRLEGEVENWNLNKIIAQDDFGVVANSWYAAIAFGITLY